MRLYPIKGGQIDSVTLKCLLVSKGVRVDTQVYKIFGGRRLHPNPLACNCMLLPCGTIVQMTDVAFHLRYLTGLLSWDNLKLMRYASQLGTPFSLRVCDGDAVLFHEDSRVCSVSFPVYTEFFQQKTSSGLPFLGNSVIQGLDWVAFQCLWPCDYACAGDSCAFCFSGGAYESLSSRGKPLPAIPSPADAAEIVGYAVREAGLNSMQLTGGSTFDARVEYTYIRGYLEAILAQTDRAAIAGEILLYITPPDDAAISDEYLSMGADRIACSLEVWDEERARAVTPGKVKYLGRARYLEALTAIAEKHGPGKAFSNLIIGLEPLESLTEGANALAERGIIPAASVWMPFGKPVMGSIAAPGAEFFRAAVGILGECYAKYRLEPAGAQGLNVCIERDIWRMVAEAA